jgi:acetyltransferase-like isoleucine patch superfamily enzyme
MRYSVKQIFGEGRLWVCNHIVNKIPSHTIRIWFYRSVMKFQIKKNSYIHLGCRFNCKNHFSIESNSVINQYCHIDNRGGVKIGENVSIAPYTKLITADHDVYDKFCKGRNEPIIIEDYCFIGFGATILGPTTMKIGSALGANSLLKGGTEAYSVYLGLPAKITKTRPSDLNYTMNYDRLFH